MIAVVALPYHFAVQSAGHIGGRVTDAAGGSLSGVTVTATNKETNARLQTETDGDGSYAFRALSIGEYYLWFEKTGFKSGDLNRKVEANQVTSADKVLEVSTGGAFASTLRGIARDPAGAAVPGVHVTATNIDTGEAYTSITDEGGGYQFAPLPVGNYRIQFAAQGFSAEVLDNVQVAVGETAEANAELTVGAVTRTVTVTAREAVIGKGHLGIRGILDQRQTSELPLISRDFTSLAALIPGVTWTSPKGPGNKASVSINGSRPDGNNFTLDGGDNNASFPATLAIDRLPLGAIVDFSVESNYQAENGRYSGGLINAVSGIREFRASGSYIHQNSSLGARDFFDRQKSRSLSHNAGLTASGPIVKDRLFLLASYEAVRALEAGPRLASVPSVDDLGAARAVLAAKGLGENPLSSRLLALFPSPDRPGAFNNTSINSFATNGSDTILIRVDYLSEHNTINAEYIFNRAGALFPSLPSIFPGFRSRVSSHGHFLSWGLASQISPETANLARFVYHSDEAVYAPEDRALDPSFLGLNTGVADPDRFGLPFIRVTGFDALGAPVTVPQHRSAISWQVLEHVSMTRGIHEIKMGLDFRRVSLNSRNESGTRGRIVFDGSVLGNPLADFLAGFPSGNSGIVRGDTRRNLAINSLDGYVQDALRVRPGLTIGLGLRYEFNGVPIEDRNRLSNFISENGGLVGVGSPQLPKLYENRFRNLAPRIGISWDPEAQGRLEIHGTWGVYYDASSQNLLSGLGPLTNSLASGPALSPIGPSPVFALSPPVPIPFGPGVAVFGSTALPGGPFDIFAVERNLKTPSLQEFSLGAKRRLASTVVVDVSYIGSVGAHLYRVIDINQPTPGPVNGMQERRPYFSVFPQFRAIDTLVSSAGSNYHSLRASLDVREWKRLTLVAGYTFSKSIDDVSNPTELPQDSRNLRAERALSNFDRRHQLVLSGFYDFKGSRRMLLDGWQVSGIFRALSGSPFSPLISFDNSGTGNFTGRPNQVSNPQLSPSDRTELFNRAAFRIPEQGTFGSVPRNSLRGPGLNDLDASVIKRTPLGSDRLKLEFRCEFFNLLNHPSFGMPNPYVDDPAFGTVTATDPDFGHRKVRLGVRILF